MATGTSMETSDTPMDDNDIKAMCTQFNIPLNELTKSFSIWRFKVLHVRGVDALTSEEVYEYFERRPYSIEWLSNISCNVTFESVSDACGALLTIAEGIIVHKNDESNVKALFDLPVITSDKLEIPVPPNYRYILGTKHPKTKAIIVRFATVNDRKTVTVTENLSAIEASKSGKNSIGGKMASDRMDIDNDPSQKSTDLRNVLSKKSGTIRFRMRADEEEERIKRSRSNRFARSDVRSRLYGSGGVSRYSRDSDPYEHRIRSSTGGMLTNSRIVKSKRTDSIWRRTVNDSSRDIRNLPRGDLRTKLSRPTLRVQVKYDDDEVTEVII